MDHSLLLLVAEDDPDDQLLIQDAVDRGCSSDVETVYVWDGVELIDFLQTKAQQTGKPVLVLLDLNMPRKDGRIALHEMKSDPDLAKIPVAVMTTSLNERDAQYCQQYGVIGYFRKPGSIIELRNIISGLCTENMKPRS